MDAVGVIMECNPFHRGHGYFLDEIKKKYGNKSIVAVMSGDFVQRGEPAVLVKRVRTEILLDAGVDLVLELPVRFSLGNAGSFAKAAVGMLNSLPAVKKIVFGSESGDIEELKEFAGIFAKSEEKESYKTALREKLKQGQSYAAACVSALSMTAGDEIKRFEGLISTPNNLLGTEYLKALSCLSSDIEPETIKRIETTVEDTHILQKDEAEPLYYSATKIRNLMYTESLSCNKIPALSAKNPTLKSVLTERAYEFMNNPRLYPITAEDFSLLLYNKLLFHSNTELAAYEDITPQLANSIKNNLSDYSSFNSYASLLQTKNYTCARIKRGLFHIVLNLKKEENPLKYTEIPLRVLGMKKGCACLLRDAKSPVITTGASINKYNKENPASYINESISASLLYRQAVIKKFNEIIPDDYHIFPVVR